MPEVVGVPLIFPVFEFNVRPGAGDGGGAPFDRPRIGRGSAYCCQCKAKCFADWFR